MKQNNAYSYKTSYDQIPQPGNPTYTEAWALIETARRMAAPIELGSLEDADNLVKARVALRLNWRLWTIFQSDVSATENPLPEDIKKNILNLSVFIDKHTVDALAAPEGRKLKVLIDINRNIASGLMANPPDSGDTPPVPPQPPIGGVSGGGDVVA